MSIGDIIRTSREQKGYSLKDVCEKTKIQPHVLEAIEKNSFDRIPSPTYTRSFLKTYSDFLGLESASIIERYDREVSQDRKQKLVLNGEKVPGDDFRQYGIPVAVGLIALALVITGVVLSIRKVGQIRSRERNRAETIMAQETAMSSGRRPAERATQGPPAKQPSGDHSRTIVSSQKLLTVAAKFSDICWLQVKGDGKEIFVGTLRAGDRKTWQAKKEITLWLGNSKAVELEVNGVPQGSLGDRVIKGIRITKEGVAVP